MKFAWMQIVLCLLISFQFGCSILQRSNKSGYYDDNYNATYRDSRKQAEYEAVISELGFAKLKELSDEQEAKVESRVYLRRLERMLTSKRELEQYYKSKNILNSDKNRIYFLQLPSYEVRARWLKQSGILAESESYTPDVQDAINSGEITTGMSSNAVRESWGAPEEIEVAGNPNYGNERWIYKEHSANVDGALTEKRLVYFEGGRVTGWERFQE